MCNYVALAYETRDEAYLQRADELIADTHSTLGRSRSGHAALGRPGEPLAGGLRIGKVAEEGEPDGDGRAYIHLQQRSPRSAAPSSVIISHLLLRVVVVI